jgi:hypothetical protein
MNCDKAAEYVSALCDGERIPRDAAEHVGTCDVCQARMRDYLAMGAELRRVARLGSPVAAAPEVWAKQQDIRTIWWQKGWQTIGIPRLVFAMLLAAIVGLGASLAIVKVKAHETGTVVMLKIAGPDGDAMTCPISLVNSKQDTCGGVAGVNGGSLVYDVKLLSKEGNRLALRVRTKFSADSTAGSFSEQDAVPQKEYWFEPGQTLRLDVPGLGDVKLTGEWTDHVPALLSETQTIDPEAGEFRMVSPLLLRDKQVAGDMEGDSVFIDKPEEGVDLYIPGQGRFEFLRTPFAGAAKAEIKLNRITFKINGEPYTILTGTPVSRGSDVWVRLNPDYKPKRTTLAGGYIGSTTRSEVEAGDALDR